MRFLRGKGRYLVAAIALVIAFALSIQLGERGVQFDLTHSSASAEESGDDYNLSSLQIFNRAILQLKENYVEPERIEPTKMLLAALDAVQNEIPEFVADYDRDVDVPETIEVQVVDERQTFRVGSMESLWEMSLRLKDIFGFVERHLPEDPDREIAEIEYAAINGMVRVLDPHSGLLTPTHYREMQTQTGGEFGGLGIVISIQDDQLTVISPIDGTPAAREGIQAQDRITRIGEESTVNMNLNEAVNRLRGEPGTTIDIWVERDGWSEPRQFTVERDIIEIESVESEPLADKIGYLRVNNFQANTYSDMREHLAELRETMGGIDGLILDMRGNPGGLLEQSIRISDIFLEEGTIVSTVGHGDRLRETREASASNTEPGYPMVVLVNEGSASASEIVAGALQQNDRAIVVGDITFGKGTVQILYEFPDDSALKMTVAQYLTPDGTSIQNKGIVPDLQAIPVQVESGAVRLFRSQLMQRERDIETSLENPSTRPDDEGPLRHIRYLDSDAFDEDAEPRDPNEFEMDFEITMSSRLLKAAMEHNRRSGMLETLQDDLEEIFETEMESIKEGLSQLDIDWSQGSTPADPSYELNVESSAHGEAVSAGESVEITASLTNRGSEPMYRAKALTRSDSPQLRHREFIFGRVDPGETKSWTVEVDIPQDARDRHDRIKFTVSDDTEELGDDYHYDLRIEGRARPHYAFSYEVVGDDIHDGMLRADEQARLRVHVMNRGEVAGENATVYLKNKTGEEIYLERGRDVISGLGAGERESVDLLFEVNAVPEGGYATLELDIYDRGFREFTQREFQIPVVDEPRDVTAVQGAATVSASMTTLHVGAGERSDPLAAVSSGAVLPVIARSGDWLKVELADRNGWVRADDVDFEQGASAELAGVDDIKKFQKSRVQLRPDGLLTSQRHISLQGLLEDDWKIDDYYIMVQHRAGPMDVNTRKLAYQRVGEPRADFNTDIPLFKGMNEITLVSRNEVGVTSRETIYVYRE